MIEDLEAHLPADSGYTELRWQNNFYTQLSLRKGSVIENLNATIGGVSARCYSNGAFGFASLPVSSPSDFDAAVRQAAANMSLLKARTSKSSAGSLPDTVPGRGTYDYRTGDAARSPAMEESSTTSNCPASQ